MLTNENGRKTKRLSREILGLLLITAVIALFFWGFLYLTANSISETYFAERNLQPSEGQWLTLRAWIRSVSLLSDGDSVSGAVSVPAGAEAGVSEGNHTGGGCPAHTPLGGYHSAARGE